MKKIYFLAVAVMAFTFTANAQFATDDFEAYNLGSMGTQSPHWDTWSGNENTGEDISVVDVEALSGFQSGLIGPGAGPQDALLKFDNKTTSTWTCEFFMLVPATKTAYFNIQGELSATGGAGGGGGGVFNSGNITFNLDGLEPGSVSDIDAGGTVYSTFSYPEGSWFPVSIFFDMSVLEYTLTIDGVDGPPTAFGADATLGGIDFYAIDANNEYYVDDVTFVEGLIGGVNDFAADNFKVYPNPVQDVLNISSKASVDAVTVYDVLGKVVLQSNPGVISPKVDMSALSSGAYLVQVTIGDASKTIKVIK